MVAGLPRIPKRLLLHTKPISVNQTSSSYNHVARNYLQKKKLQSKLTIILDKLTDAYIVNKFVFLTESEGTLTYSQQPTTHHQIPYK